MFDTTNGNGVVVMINGKIHRIIELGNDFEIFQMHCDCGAKVSIVTQEADTPLFCPVCGAASAVDEGDYFDEEDETDDT